MGARAGQCVKRNRCCDYIWSGCMCAVVRLQS
ncbi:hypothetical protein M8C21_014944 [Ambrosia artemisiifolia]|uniref:Uncharacterized protein n=1 Tax=Ambrosia artemisiifolia TaxID=4212 RepID=A0AAD5G9H9_AMBAR|nr:hypothetical protein M8C21_014944 [Ambrosia artemisiifolia]